MAAGAALLGWGLASREGVLDNYPDLLLLAFSSFLMVSAFNSLNDFFDHRIDRTAHPERPIPSGRMTREAARNNSILLLSVSLMLGTLLSINSSTVLPLLLLFLALFMDTSYELFLKKLPFLGNLSVALLTGFPFLYGASITSFDPPVVILALMAVVVNLSREVIKDVEDLEADKVERRTVPAVQGEVDSLWLALAMTLLGIALSLWLYITIRPHTLLILFLIISDVELIISCVTSFTDAERAQKYMKVGMVLLMLGMFLYLLV